MVATACGSPSSSESETKSLPPAAVDYVTLPSIVRLTPHVDVAQPDASDAIELDAARGEREGGQLVAWAKAGEPRVVLETSALRGPSSVEIAATHVHPYIEHAMTVERGSPGGRPGTYMDPLIPARKRDVVLGDSQRLLAWIDVTVPLDTKPGQYTGHVLIRESDEHGKPIADDESSELARIPIRVRVHAATIPKTPTLGSYVGLDQSQLVRFENVPAGSTKLRDVTERYVNALADARLSVGDVGALPPGALAGHHGLPGDDDYLERVFGQRGVASVRIPLYETYPFKDPLGADRAQTVRYLRRAAAWARSHGWADRMYVFMFDEPDDSEAGDVRELHELMREADPQLRQLVTREGSARSPFQGSVDIWAPNINPQRFRETDVSRERARGKDTWWYPSITTTAPYPTLFIDELRPTPRALGWLAWQRGVRGFLYWSATHWHEVDDPFEDPSTYNETNISGNGDGVLLYPGGAIGLPGTPIPSVRLLQLRDGIEDHDLLADATCAATSTQRARIRRAVAAAAPAIDRIDPTAAQVQALRQSTFAVLDRAPVDANCADVMS